MNKKFLIRSNGSRKNSKVNVCFKGEKGTQTLLVRKSKGIHITKTKKGTQIEKKNSYKTFFTNVRRKLYIYIYF